MNAPTKLAIRDKFALNCPFTLNEACTVYCGDESKSVVQVYAEMAYEYADQMLKIRLKENK